MAKLELDFTIGYSAGISACEKGVQWQWAVALLSEMREAKLELSVIFSFSAGISACEKGDQWQRALALLYETWEAKLEPDEVSSTALGSARAREAKSSSGLWRCTAGSRRRSLSSASFASVRLGIAQSGSRALVLLSEMQEAKLEPNVISCSAGIRASENPAQRRRALPHSTERCRA
ncbi:unnamed protein product [Prorocentrum cordatum]|uniref:Pentatricopeptide repeat-containing protein, chloroplastic n=1 Tax=Prorocentrum cordatum TaxID=2364126 RepID=A0ABN9WCQ2_9DINO|nr:unnamed protein product [Polarella glacialis]